METDDAIQTASRLFDGSNSPPLARWHLNQRGEILTQPATPLMTHPAHPAFAALPAPSAACHAIVAIPARNEEACLWRTLFALHTQQELDGSAMSQERYEVLLLLNGCTDGSLRVAEKFRATFPGLCLHVAVWTFAADDSHVGSARSMLLHEAARRLALQPHAAASPRLLLTTDADTVVAPTWIAETVRCVRQGADAVGGNILTHVDDRRTLPALARKAYVLDRRYRLAVARLEALLDPQQHDPWPRHQHHFGGSMACTLSAYQRSGGMQAVPQLEDLAFYHALLECGARFRHEPRVQVHTSTRMHGRAIVGMSEQLNQWKRPEELRVCATDLLVAGFMTRALLRVALQRSVDYEKVVAECAARLGLSGKTVEAALQHSASAEACWRALDGERRVRSSMPETACTGEMRSELNKVQRLIRSFDDSAATHPCDMWHAGAPPPAATMAD